MTADDVIESYVIAVAKHLPARLRRDVAAELRSQLADELHGAGAADDVAALALVRRFGRPNEVAARYHAPYTLIDPADTRSFVLAAVLGALLIPGTNRRVPVSLDPNTALLVLLAWLGALLVFFAARSWMLHRWPQSFAWTPSPVRRERVSPPAELGLAALLALLGVFYWMPGPILSALSGGRIEAGWLAYTQDFQSPLRMAWFPILLAVLIALHLLAAITRRRPPVMRFLLIAFVACAGLQLGWHVAYGHVFANPDVDFYGRLVMQLAGAGFLMDAGIGCYREWTRVPAADPLPRAGEAVQ
jgi:hypothetical protein